MKVLILLFCVAIPCVLGIFDGRDSDPFRRGDQFEVTGNLLQCREDFGSFLTVGLNVTTPGEVFTPLTSRYRYPSSLLIPSLAVAQIANQLNLSDLYQDMNVPPNDTLYFPMRYVLDSNDYEGLQSICGQDVLANITGINGNTRNEDQGTFWDITNTLENDWLNIWNITDRTQVPSFVNEVSWTTNVIGLFRDMLQVLSCRVAFRWADAGPTYVPRYFLGGFCLNRKCSMPDRDELRCHADLSPAESRFLEAARWDCCWTYSIAQGYKYECGFRKVRFPIVCDCDCRCADKAGI